MAKSKNNGNNTILLVLVGIVVVCFIAIGILFYKYFYAGSGSTKYGDRLIDIDNYVLSDSLEKDIQDIYASEKSIDKVTVNNKGRIIYINMYFNTATKTANVQNLAIKALDKIGEENLKYYEVQYLITYTGSETLTNFPMYGSKNCNSTKVSWKVAGSN